MRWRVWTANWRYRSLAAVFLCCAVMPAAVEAAQCPEAVRLASRLVLVEVPDINAPKASVQTFERERRTRRWQAVSAPQAAVVGRSGIGWGYWFENFAAKGEPIKQEGDGRTPAGIYLLQTNFGFSRELAAGGMTLVPGRQVCVDDLSSPHYGAIVPRTVAGPATSGEQMADIPVYRRGIIVGYPRRARKKAGSCIFVHVWSGPNEGTAGCIALAEPAVAALQSWQRRGRTAIAIIPDAARRRFAGCLPQ